MTEQNKKQCVGCKATKVVTEFYKNGKTKAGEIKYVTTCKDCWKAKYSLQARRDKTKKNGCPTPRKNLGCGLPKTAFGFVVVPIVRSKRKKP